MDQSRRSWMSYALFFGIFLSPVLLQPVDCERGNPNLASLEFESEGQNQIVAFSPSQTVYDVSVGSSPAILRAYSQDATATVSYRFWDNSVFIDTVPLGTGGGVANITVPEGQSTFQVSVATREGGSQFYSMNVVHAAAGFPCTEQGIRDAIAGGGGPYYFDCAGPTTVTTTSEIVIDNYEWPALILDGEGNLTVDGGGSHRVFSVTPSASRVELRGFHITGGATSGDGGGIHVSDVSLLTLSNSTVVGNSADGNGGGIYAGEVILLDSVVSQNTAGEAGGGVFVETPGGLFSERSAITQNVASGTVGEQSGGGGVYVHGSSAGLTASDTTISSNTAASYGAGIRAHLGDISLERCTVSRNFADIWGGGIYNGSSSGSTTLTNSTVSGNHGRNGGGIYHWGYQEGVDLTLVNTTVSNNTSDENATAISAVGPPFSSLNNVELIGSVIEGSCQIANATLSASNTIESPDNTCDLPFGQGNRKDVSSSELKLGTLQDNGGETLTHAPATGSVLLEAISVIECIDERGQPLSTDQRGFARPESSLCDIGSVEGVCADCSDGDECTVDTCDPIMQGCSNPVAPDGTFCASGDGRCVDGACDLCADVICADDGNECTVDACEPSTGVCASVPAPDGTSCDSGNAQCSAGGCRGPEIMSHPGLPLGRAEDPRVAMDPWRNAFAVWNQEDVWSTHYDVWAKALPASGEFLLPVVTSVNDRGAGDQRVATDPDGNAIAVWTQWDGVANSVYASRYTPADGWGLGEVIDSNNGLARYPDVAIDANGFALAVWRQSDGVVDSIWANQYSAFTDTWGEEAELVETLDVDGQGAPLHASNPRVALDWDGTPSDRTGLVVWQQPETSGGPEYVWAALYDDGWQPPEQLGEGQTPQVAMHAFDEGFAAWENGGIQVRRFRHAPGSDWEPAVVITDSVDSGNNWEIAMADKGRRYEGEERAVIVWSQDGDVWAKYYSPDDPWGIAEPLESHGGVASGPQVAMDAYGSAVAVWEQDDGVSSNIWANNYQRTPSPYVGEGWATARLLEYLDTDAHNPDVAIDKYRNGFAVWEQWTIGPGFAFYDIYGQNTRVQLQAPTLSNPTNQHVSSTQWCLPNNYFRFRANFSDPDGDVVSWPEEDTVQIFIDVEFSNNNGWPDTYESDTQYNQLSGDGYTGTVTANNCLYFGAREWADISITIWDAANHESTNTVTTRVTKPAGAD